MRLALAQIISTDDGEANLAIVERFATDARAQGAELVVFPEATMRAFGGTLADVAEPIDGPWATAVRAIAARLDLTIVVGMFTPGEAGRVRNTLLVAAPDTVAHYDKVHLFDAFGFAESDTVDAGDRAVTVAVGGTTIGLATCYDLRFPALFLSNAVAGARLSIVCASWGAGPGKAEQWDLLVRARAVDTTTFVIAVGQGDPASQGRASTGAAPTGIGRSAVVSPFGEILHQLGAQEGLLVVDVDPGELDAARQKLPVLANRRLDL
ncbi:carbon-nitrogen hydrolase family protein [Pengzhenrongella sp.]|jgi:predicted amidohydrolase|uniref:carbon-nitrogen hydrolase family protein n=1 Tax=Pengzhenrongella sp. TaxID=2888820 RepID=UPI002F9375A1